MTTATVDEAFLLAALRAILIDGARSTDVVARSLRGVATHDERRATKDTLFGITVLQRRLCWLAGLAWPVVDTDLPALLATWRTHPVDDGAAAVDADDLAVRRSTPSWLAHALVASHGLEGADRFLVDANRPGPTTLRANVLKGDRLHVQHALATEGIVVTVNDNSPWALNVVGHANLFGSNAFRAGLFEVQDASSQQVVLEANATPGDVVIDLCAGRGGKTLGLAATMQNSGRVLAHDVDGAALRDLRGRLGRSGALCVEVVDNVNALPALVGAGADVVVVDAPCSSTGVLRRSPDLRWRLQPEDVAAVTPVQRQLLARAATLVRPGGRVVYATCSALSDENEAVVATVPQALAETNRRHLGASCVGSLSGEGGDGFFIASFARC
jgi:16S rRNA (cytosine967-C5)-methyltransferase